MAEYQAEADATTLVGDTAMSVVQALHLIGNRARAKIRATIQHMVECLSVIVVVGPGQFPDWAEYALLPVSVILVEPRVEAL